jgi:hypothetical protein
VRDEERSVGRKKLVRKTAAIAELEEKLKGEP